MESTKGGTGLLGGQYAAFVLVIFADLSFTLVDTTAQNLGQHGISPFQIVFMRMSITFIGVSTYLLFGPPRLTIHDIGAQISPYSSQGRLIWLRSINIVIGVSACYYALSQIDVSAFITIFHLRPFPTAFACYLVLKEPFGKVQTVSCLISLMGLALVVHTGRAPSTDKPMEGIESRDWVNEKDRPEHIALAWGCTVFTMLMSALEYLNTRMIDPSTNPVILLFTYCITAIVLMPMAMFLLGATWVLGIPAMGWVKVLVLACLGLIAQVLLVMALQREKGGRVAVISYLQIPMAVLIQLIFVGTLPTITMVIGMVIIIAAGMWAMLDARGRKAEEIGHEQSSDEEQRGSYKLVSASEEM